MLPLDLCPNCALRDQDPADDVYGWCGPCVAAEAGRDREQQEELADRRRQLGAQRSREFRARWRVRAA